MFDMKAFCSRLDVAIVFGVPGCGKTTLLSKIAKYCNKYGIKVYANVTLKDIDYVKIESHDIGKYDLHDGIILIDEASVDFNNRDFKNLNKSLIAYAKYHRHYNTKIVIFSQSYEDMDITFRRLADRFYLCRRWLLGFSLLTPIDKKVGIDEVTHQITDIYFFKPLTLLTSGFTLRRLYYRYFDSFTRPLGLPVHPREVMIHEKSA